MKTEKLLNRYEESVKERAVFAHKNKELNCVNQSLKAKLKMSKQMLEIQKDAILELRTIDIDKKIAFYNELNELGILKENSVGIELQEEKQIIQNEQDDRTEKSDDFWIETIAKQEQEAAIKEIMDKDAENGLYQES